MDRDYFTIDRLPPAAGMDGVQVSRVHLAGEFDLGAREELRDTLLSIVGGDDSAHVVVDLSDVTFIDSEGLSAILDGYVAAQQEGIRFRLVNGSRVVRRLLEIIDMTALLDDTSQE